MSVYYALIYLIVLFHSIPHQALDESIGLLYIVLRGGDLGPFVSPRFSAVDAEFLPSVSMRKGLHYH